MTRREVATEYGVDENQVPFDDPNVEVWHALPCLPHCLYCAQYCGFP